MIKDSKFVKINKVNPLYFTFSKVNGYFEEINKNKYLMPVLTNESKEIIKEFDELWRFLFKIRDLTRLITKNSDDYDEKYMKSNLN